MAVDLEITPGRWIGRKHPCFIVAEIGQNHQGDLNVAKKLIQAAKDCGADCVKFQKSSLQHKFTQKALQRPYTSTHSWGNTYGEHKQYLEFSNNQFIQLQQYAENEVGIPFTSSAMDKVSASFLDSINVPFIKIGSGDANNFMLLDHVSSMKRPLVISTGMQDMVTVEKVYKYLCTFQNQFCLMHCVSSYPVPAHEVNLKVLELYQDKFPDIHIGYSGHEEGTSISVAAVALGARIIERHLTLNHSWKGNDHKCSLEPPQFAHLVKEIRQVEVALGMKEKCQQPSERICSEKLGKSVVAAKHLPRNKQLDASDLDVKVDVTPGWAPQHWKQLIGKTLITDKHADETFYKQDFYQWSTELSF